MNDDLRFESFREEQKQKVISMSVEMFTESFKIYAKHGANCKCELCKLILKAIGNNLELFLDMVKK